MENTSTRQITVDEADYLRAKKIHRLVQEFDYFRVNLPKDGTTEEDRVAICNKFFDTLISREAFKKLLAQYPQTGGIVDGLMDRLRDDMWIFLTTYFDVAEEPSEVPMWYLTRTHMLFAALSVFKLDNEMYGLRAALMMPFKDIIEIMLKHYDNLLQKELPNGVTSAVVDEGPIITEI